MLDGPTLVPHNRWDLLSPPDLDHWQPSRRVSVVIPHYEAREELARTLAALAAQRYPHELLEVLVVDDGSDPPLTLPSVPDHLDVRVLHQPRQGFGAARARNLGAAEASGEVLVFLDADMIPARDLIAAHARWAETSPDAVTLGRRTHVACDDLPPEAIGEAIAADGFDALLTGREQTAPAWIDGHLRRTTDLTSADDDLFRVVTSGNLGVSRALFASVGGFDASFDRWGGEDTELGARLFVAGAVLVPEPAARCWHQGPGHAPSDAEVRSLDEQRVRLAHLIAHRGFRRLATGRSYLVPRVAVHVAVATDDDREVVCATVESVLASDVSDLAVVLPVPAAHPDAWWLHQQFAADPRVVADASALPAAVPAHVELPAGTLLAPSALTVLLARLRDVAEPVGLIAVTVPDRRPGEASLRAWTTRAASRVARALAAERGADGGPPHGVDQDAVLTRVGEVFGREWLAGADVGVRWWHSDTEVAAEAEDTPAVTAAGLAAAEADARALWQVLSRLGDQQRREVITAARLVVTHVPAPYLARLARIGGRLLPIVPRLRRVWWLRHRRDVRVGAAVLGTAGFGFVATRGRRHARR